MRMLSPEYAIEDAIERGLETPEVKDGEEVGVMDTRYHFAIFRVENGVARTVVSGPFSPDKETLNN